MFVVVKISGEDKECAEELIQYFERYGYRYVSTVYENGKGYTVKFKK